ncbi:hypothetical protein DYB35_002836 [Aphanomyces astaci]|uniref:DDE-1 domain-containing protein n=1 Tax=Aphanomyces astaci TaxID=112090 RepID=A0A3R7AHM9_APHAT|nr:hypothetical protein DYB35_002836 [Aphanomyces astaci]
MTTLSTLRLRRKRYEMAVRLQVLELVETSNVHNVSKLLGIPRRTIRSWIDQKDDILAFDGNKKRMKLSLGGNPESFPDPVGLLEFIKEMRVRRFQTDWLRTYLAGKALGTGYQGILRLLQRFCHRHGFSRRKAGCGKQSQAALIEVRDEFAEEFHRSYRQYGHDTVYNVDETGFYYDMPPRYIWDVRDGGAKISSGEKHSMRMTVVLTARADGTKLPMLFVIRGASGGRIETNEFPTFPAGLVYAMQNKAWMDDDVWKTYLRSLLLPMLVEPSVLLLDNFVSHVSDESYKIVNEELSTHLVALLANATSVCQPLDVGVMGPFKRYLRDAWLAEDIIEGDDGDEFDTLSAAMPSSITLMPSH